MFAERSRLASKNAVLDRLRFYEIKLSCYFVIYRARCQNDDITQAAPKYTNLAQKYTF